ncbi:MAG TPA: hypothetical protein VK507_21310 [Iamia sp.]|nr:hypothetical protein [Iamia sp.]
MPATPEARLDALRLTNAEIQGRIDFQRAAIGRVETKLQAVVGFASAGAALLVSGNLGAVPIYGVVGLVLSALLAAYALRPTEVKVVPDPARLIKEYEAAIQRGNPEEILLAKVVPTKADALAQTLPIDERKVVVFRIALYLLLAGVIVSVVTLVWWDGGTLKPQQVAATDPIAHLGGAL